MRRRRSRRIARDDARGYDRSLASSAALGSHRDVRIRILDWDEARDLALALRTQVFVDEQHVPMELELDGLDEGARHAVAVDDNGEVVGTARILPTGKIGRMAVRRDRRSMGVGAALVEALVGEARRTGIRELVLDAQCHAIGFYERFGFVAEGSTFFDAGIQHRRMRRRL